MNGPRQARWCSALCAAAMLLAVTASAQNETNPASQVRLLSVRKSPLPPGQSPVDFFRQLLTMTPAERGKSLAIYPPQIHKRILAKVQEYLALNPNERELRLRATDLRWYLLPLLLESPTNRTARLALVPDDLRELVNARLAQWDALPPPSRQEFLANEQTLDYFSHVDSTNVPPTLGGQGAPSTEDQARWNALSESERRQISAQFDRFFELTPDEKQKALNTLSDAERVQMEKTLQTFDNLPPMQRAQCIRAYTEFAGMSSQERAEFLKNAARWSQMTPKDRQAWRDLVAQVPLWPPLPHALIMPPKPPQPPAQSPLRVRQMVATNHN